MESVHLLAPDISCEHCQRAIESSLSKLTGVDHVRVDIPAKLVQVEYNPQRITVAKIEEELDDIGYPVAK